MENFKWFYSLHFEWFGQAVNYCVKINTSLENIWKVETSPHWYYFYVRSKVEEVSA